MNSTIPTGFWFGWNIANVPMYIFHIKTGSQCAIELLITTIVLLLFLKLSKNI